MIGWRVGRRRAFAPGPPTHADLPALLALNHAREIHLYAETAETLPRLTARYSLPGFDGEHDAWLVVDPTGEVVGEAWVWTVDRHIDFWGIVTVHPRYADGPLAAYLIGLIEARAGELALPPAPGHTIDLTFYSAVRAQELQTVLADAGYALVRHAYRMTIDPRAVSEAPEWPAGIVVRALDLDRDAAAVHAAIEEAFAEHFRFTPTSLEHFVAEMRSNAAYEASLWHIAWDGEQVAGALGAYDYGTLGEVDVLGLRKPWRGRGLAKALLRRSFADFASRDRERVSLYVDAGNTTGAVELYSRVGMSIAEENGSWTKPLSGAI
jgi:mycothiol synthase